MKIRPNGDNGAKEMQGPRGTLNIYIYIYKLINLNTMDCMFNGKTALVAASCQCNVECMGEGKEGGYL